MSEKPKGHARRVLITGLSTYWGGRLAQALESFPEVEAIIGVDSKEPTVELERTEFVKVGTEHSLIERIVTAADIDTLIDTRLAVDSVVAVEHNVDETNVIGTLNILAACSAENSPVRRLVFKSSGHWYGCTQSDPAFFTEEMSRRDPPTTQVERDVVETEAAVADFAEKRPGVTVTVLRFANVLGPGVDTSHTRLFSLPAVPMVLGFDPRYQFVHEDDVVHALEHAAFNDLPGAFNVAGDGVLALSEVIGLLGKQPLPVLPPWGTGLFISALSRLGFRVPKEMINQLRYGRGLDNRLFRSKGFEYKYSSRETVLRLGSYLRVNPVIAGTQEPYRYEREVEEFLRWSPHVRGSSGSKRVGREDAAMFEPSPPVADPKQEDAD